MEHLLAELLMSFHLGFVLFVVAGLLLVVLGGLLGWRWIRNPVFRLAHLAAIAIVVIQSWFGVACFLTVWENRLRVAAGETPYRASFVGHWVERLLYYDAPPWVFAAAYTAFGAAVLATWFWPRTRPALRAARSRRPS